MSYPAVPIDKRCWLVRAGPGSSATVKPAFNNNNRLGLVRTITLANEREPVVFERSEGGILRDDRIFEQRDRLTATITVAELSQACWEILFGADIPLSGGAGTFSPGAQIGTIGPAWLKVAVYMHPDLLITNVEIWGHASIESLEIPATGLQEVTLRFQKLYSTLNSGDLANVV